MATFLAPAAGAQGDETKGFTPGVYAVFETSLGNIWCRLFVRQAPQTTANFIGLVQGTKEWKDPRLGQMVKKPLYDGLIFHRVIPNFMIQTGDPLGNGSGGPGFNFADEIVAELKFDQPGRLAMANRGPDTNGSQIFITHKPTSWLDGKHTIFGQVVKGQDVVDKIGAVPRDRRDKPLTDVELKKVSIVEIK